MKKIIVFLLLFVFLFALSGCIRSPEKQEDIAKETIPSQDEKAEISDAPVKPIKIATLAGPTGMGLIGLINDESGKYEVEILTQPDQLSPKIINGEVDIATIPSNLGAVLYNKMGGGISVIAVNTTGVLYLVSSEGEISSLDDIAEKTIVSSGQGASPEYVLTRILEENSVDAKVEYLPAHADLSNAMAAGDVSLGLLPEPFVSITLAKNPDLSVVLDLNDEWQRIYGQGVEIPMGIAVVSNEFLEENPEGLENFISDYKLSVEYVNGNIESAAEDIAAAGLLPKATIAKLAIPRSSITFVMGKKSKDMLEEFFGVLFESNPKSVGGDLPGEEFYYRK